LSKIIHLNGDSKFTEDDIPWGPAQFSEIECRKRDAQGRTIVDSPENMLAAARNEAQRIRDEAYREGYDAGRTEAAGEVAGEGAKLLETLKGLNIELRNEEQRMLEEVEPQLIELAVQIAEKILHRELTQDAEAVRATVTAALNKLTERDRVTIRANPADEALLKEFKIDIAESFDGVREVCVVADENIARGGCVVETDMLRVNGDIDAQLKEIQQQLME
jgi:flagellar assembly protein FliH